MTQQQTLQEMLAPILSIRRLSYDFLRQTFLQEPTYKYLKIVSTPEFIEAFPFSEENELIYQGVRNIASYLKQHDPLQEKDQLDWDYTRLFIGPYALLAPPWESAYLSEERLLFQESTLQVRQAYAKYGLLSQNHQHEADDHLSLELDFMFQLATKAEERYNHFSEFQEILFDSKSFLQNHLLNWVPTLARDIRQNANTGLYQGMADILEGYLQLDAEALDELINIQL